MGISGRLTGKVAIVTGAGRGIGRGIAIRLAKEGAGVAVASRSADTVERVTDEVRALGAPAAGIAVDVGDRPDVERMVATTVETLGRVDILVNNAQGWGSPTRRDVSPPMHPLEAFPEDEWDFTFQTGVKASLYGMQAVFPHLRDAGWGRIINFASPAATQGMPGLAAYNANKEAIRGLTVTAAREWGKYGITVNCISPVIPTDSMRAYVDTIDDPAQREAFIEASLARIPVGRVGDAEADTGAVAVFLASDDAGFMTGRTLYVDGGTTLGSTAG
jgi:NAD(P)-dependent dehydrogenase (short-subunit alcohol dehydrogenase family)